MAAMDRFDSMNSFVRVMDCGSFTGAARRLALSPATVTLHVRDLESRLGVRLLNRTTRKVSPTQAGRIFYGRCKRLLRDLQEAESAVSEQQTTLRGVLHVNASPSFGMLHLPPAIAQFSALYPEVSVELTLTDRGIDLVAEDLDLAVRAEPLPDSSFIGRQLALCRTALCAAPSYLEKRGVPTAPSDLARHNCLTLSTPPVHSEWVFTGPDGREHRVRISGNLRANSSGALIAAAVAGQGLILEQTCSVGNDLKSGRLVPVLGNYALPDGAIRAGYPHNRRLSAKVRTFVDFLVARFGHDPHWDDWRRPFAICASDGQARSPLCPRPSPRSPL